MDGVLGWCEYFCVRKYIKRVKAKKSYMFHFMTVGVRSILSLKRMPRVSTVTQTRHERHDPIYPLRFSMLSVLS